MTLPSSRGPGYGPTPQYQPNYQQPPHVHNNHQTYGYPQPFAPTQHHPSQNGYQGYPYNRSYQSYQQPQNNQDYQGQYHPYATNHAQPVPVLPIDPNQYNQVPNSPGQASDASPEQEDAIRSRIPVSEGVKYTYIGKIWELEVVQQPVRARMCGFGDRDRRPITAPPVVKLIIREEKTKEEINYQSQDLVLQHLICMAHIYDQNGKVDKSIIRGNPQQGIISAANIGGFPTKHVSQTPINEEQPAYLSQRGQQNRPNGYCSGPFYPTVGAPPPPLGLPGSSYIPAQPPYRLGSRTTLPPPVGMHPLPPLSPPSSEGDLGVNHPSGPPVNMNLIGSNVASAQLLQDEQNKWGIFFIYSDLSVRSEDWYTLKFEVSNIGKALDDLSLDEIQKMGEENNAAPSRDPNQDSGKRGNKSYEGIRNSLIVDQGKSAPVVATCFSRPFKSYTAKKFPGVADSTSLSKCFAKQGVKISIRKDNEKAGKKRKRNGDDGDDDDEDEDDSDV